MLTSSRFPVTQPKQGLIAALLLICCALFACYLQTANAADPSGPWDPKVKPRISQAQAIQIMRASYGDGAQHFILRSADLRTSAELRGIPTWREKSRTNLPEEGEWRMIFTNKHDNRSVSQMWEISVFFKQKEPHTLVRFYPGLMAR